MANVHPLLAPMLFSFQQAREDLALHTQGLSPQQIWSAPPELAPLGFHLRHIAGSLDRLATYLDGRQLTAAQLAALQAELEPGASREELLEAIDVVLTRVGEQVRAIDVNRLTEARAVGRRQLPTTVIGLLVHIAEHTQRHAGQAIILSKLARQLE